MIRVEAIENFSYKEFNNITELVRANCNSKYENIRIYVGDTFVITEDQYNYLIKDNPTKKALVRIIEYVP